MSRAKEELNKRMNEGEMCDEVAPVIANDKESMEAMTAAELTEKPGLLNLRAQDPNQASRSWTRRCVQTTFPAESGAHLEKWNRGAQGTSGNTRTPLLMSSWKTLKHRAEVETKFHVEEEKAAEIKKQVHTAKNSPEAQQLLAPAALKEVAEMQHKCNYSVKDQVAENTCQDHSVKTDRKT